MKSIWLALIVVIALMVAGCGGGGGGSAAPASVATRQIQPGDEIGYEVTTEYSDGELDVTEYQVYRYTASDKTPAYGNRALMLTVYGFRSGLDPVDPTPLFENFDRDHPEYADSNSEIFVEQASDGNIYMRGQELESEPLPDITGNPILYPASPKVGQTYSYTLDHGDRVYKISGRVAAYAAKDGYMAYKIHEEVHVSGNVINGGYGYAADNWFAPELGCMIESKLSVLEQPSTRTILKMIYKNF